MSRPRFRTLLLLPALLPCLPARADVTLVNRTSHVLVFRGGTMSVVNGQF